MHTNNQFLDNCTILIIDDEISVQRVIIKMFATTSANILSAPNANIGIKIAQKRLPDLILMDWNMPGISGIEALQILKVDQHTQHIPVIIITAFSISSLQSFEALTTGADDFLKKPFDSHELLGRVSAVLRQYNSKKQIEVQNENLRKLSSDQSKLLSVLSHDLKSPLNNIEALVNLTELHLKENTIDDETQNYLTLITKIVRQERDLINKILEMHEFESMQSYEEYHPIKLTSWLEEQLNPFQNNPKQIAIEYSYNDHFSIYSIPVLLKKIIDNLVSNALKYSYPNTTIQLKVVDKTHAIQLSIKDQGQGFHPDEMHQVFQKFSKLSARPTGGESSSGIGLYIVKSSIERLGGSIELISQSGKGSEFIILLPKNTPTEKETVVQH